MSNIGKLAELYGRMKADLHTETEEAKAHAEAQAKLAGEKANEAAVKEGKAADPNAGKVDASILDKIDMIELQQQMAADELFVSTVSNVMKKESDTAQQIASNFK